MSAESKSDASDRLRPSTSDVSPSNTAVTNTTSPLHAQSVASSGGDGGNDQLGDQHKPNRTSSVNRQTAALYQHYLNTFNSSLSKEEVKSQRTRGSIPSSISQQMQQNTFREFQNHHYATHSYANQRSSGDGGNNQQLRHSPRLLNHNMAQQFHQTPPTRIPSSHNLNHYASPNITSNVDLSRSAPRDEAMISYRSNSQPQQQNQSPTHLRTYSTGALPMNSQPSHQKLRQSRDVPSKMMSAHNIRRDQQDRDSEEATTIREELENDLEGCKNSELEAISSLERNLPIELSFLIRQQAHCLAKTNYLERQLRELRETVHHQQQVDMNRVPSGSITNRNHPSRPTNMGASATLTHTKNGNFILSDDSGGEYSRATLSDDDELSSLLDQIVKTVRPDQRVMNDNMLVNSDSQLQHPLQQQQYPQQNRLTTAYSAIITKQQHQQPQQQQPYAIISPNQIHPQQAVPIFVMSSPFAVAHPSSINSNILPGVHFQPEPRYNQYYEDFYAVNNTPPATIAAPTSSVVHRQLFNPNSHRSQHFDNSISAIEQLVSQKEKLQIIAQMKSADNWLKMRTSNSGSFNQQEGSMKNASDKQTAMTTSDETQGQGDAASIR